MPNPTTKSNRVLLHLGIHKTASSSIQRTLAARDNRRALARCGIVVPTALASNCSGFFMSAFSEHPERYHANIREGLGPERIAEQVRVQKHRLASEMRGLESSTVVFSGEDGCMLSAAGLGKLRDFVRTAVPGVAEISVIAYTREPVSYVSSAIQENVKGNGRTIAQARVVHINASRNRYKSLFDRLAVVFGADRVAFRSFETASSQCGDVVVDFLRWIGAADDSMRIERVNESASSEAIRLLSYLYEQGIEVGPGDKAAILAMPGSRRPLVEREHRERILEVSAGDRAFLRDRFGIDYDRSVAAPGNGDSRDEAAREILNIESRLDEHVRAAVRSYLRLDADHKVQAR